MRKTLLATLMACAVAVQSPLVVADTFVIGDIRVEGLQRIAPGTVFNYLPVEVGDRLDARLSADAIRALYRTHFFDDVRLEREGDVLVVFVVERPAIDGIQITGNRAIKEDQLRDALRQIGLVDGRVYDPAMLERIERELQEQYFALGRYTARVTTTARPLQRNRVAIDIEIFEGAVARIREINLVGNQLFSDRQLLRGFESGPRSGFAFMSRRDQYSREKLAGDLENLRSWYLDRGYLNFSIDSTQVSLTPDRRHVYITINLTEGPRYTVDEVRLAGELVVDEAELRELITVQPGEVFSRRQVTESATRISDRLGSEGYAFANVNPVPDLDEANHTATLTFYVDPSRRVYVRRVNISGNDKTRDEVIRREIRQMESAPLDTARVQLSRERLGRLGYFEDINVETPPVAGSSDEVDVEFQVREMPTGAIMAGIGYSQSQGVVFNAGLQQNNFMGTGKRVAINLDNSKVQTIYSLSYTDPYHTIDGVSRTLRGFYEKTDADEARIAAYTMDRYGAGVVYGLPISEFNTIRFGGEAARLTLKRATETPNHIIPYLGAHRIFKLITGLSRDTRDRAIFPTRGLQQSADAEIAVPGSDEQFYRLTLSHVQYLPVADRLTLALGGSLGYGRGFGSSSRLPPFEHFYAGGFDSVRGFRDHSLGPRDTDYDRPIGGDTRVLGSAELFFPAPFGNEQSLRLSTFLDAGNVFNSDHGGFRASDIRYSTGVALNWLSPIGGLRFSFAVPMNDKSGDKKEQFQFSLGAQF